MISGQGGVNNRGFARQCANFMDASACLDILQASVFSMAYGGFDTHRDQASRISDRFSDLFGVAGPLGTMMSSLRASRPDVADRVVIMVSGEFGRQLAANGDQGTDHGRGNSVILIGKQVSGGLYGDLFPEEEIDRFDDRGSDIRGLIGIENLVHHISESMMAGSGDRVVPVRPDERRNGASPLNFLG
jgi:uncharacterized protein (DUF1501 family)